MMEHSDAGRQAKVAPRKRRLADNLSSVVVTGLICGALLTVMYGVTLHRADEQAGQHQVEMRHEPGPPPGSMQRPPA